MSQSLRRENKEVYMNIMIAGLVKRFSIENGCIVTFTETENCYCFTVDVDGKHKKSTFVKKNSK